MGNKKTDDITNYKSQTEKSSQEIEEKFEYDPTQYGDWQHKGKVTDF